MSGFQKDREMALLEFPSPCGVRRVRDNMLYVAFGLMDRAVSVPLRGKEGAGRPIGLSTHFCIFCGFPSPCGVRRVRDPSM